ncbi:ABC transporter substrate-binding protein [Pseudooceanicola aestuarii]|uniref:ABC transporter substrate-binding protein n=1 Tax=Pseudooceanicola aestuarii TaxID=2697319 RepID=UPI0013D71E39|nr:ABC transporter substrate-binding protein [Pseudooceanicola aestuarii]
MIRRILPTSAALLALATPALAQSGDPVRLGLMFGLTGPIESLAATMAASARLAVDEVNAAGGILDGRMVETLEADTGCIDNDLATSGAERLIGEGVSGLVGPDCSGVTGAVLQNVAVPNGMALISPSAVSPGLGAMEDRGLFFRTAPSAAREGQVMTEMLGERGIGSVALTYTNNDYGKGLADSFQTAFEAAGGTVTTALAHEDGKGDYSAEVATLDAAGGDVLVVAGYLDQGGLGIIRAATDTDAFDTFMLPGGMVGDSLTDALGDVLDGSFGQIAGTQGEGVTRFHALAEAGGVDGTSTYAPESYDAAALMLLAMAQAGSAAPADYAPMIEDVANAPGEVILPGELGRALEIIAAGGEIDYAGASSVELINGGESAGSYREIEVTGGKMETVRYR